ncbi:MAG: polysaccharide pyruvyl transferase family protein, partial [Sulfurovum sp.]|nr:polysaccharide pyruvyl transferase family protein [Sulfurovum sp.]
KQIQEFYTDVPIYFLANTKTDMYLAKKLKEKYGFSIFSVPEKHDRAMAVIAKAYIVIGGRQHPNIFAAMQGVPFIPLQGNTHKMEGVVELLNYPLPVLKWNESSDVIQHTFKMLEDLRDKLHSILTVPKLKTICLSNKQ